MSAKGKKIEKIVAPYCDKIRFTGRHYTCYPKGYDGIITFGASSSDRMQHKRVYRDFKVYANIIIKELLYM